MDGLRDKSELGLVRQTLGELGLPMNHSFLTREEERRLALVAQNGNLQAKEKLVASNVRLVVSIANKLRARVPRGDNPMLELEDLVACGIIGLVRAIQTFDPDENTRLSTWATPRIIGEMRLHLRKFISRGVTMPSDAVQKARKLSKNGGRAVLRQRELVGEDLRYPEWLALYGAPKVVSLDAPLKLGDNDSSPLGNSIADLITDYDAVADEAIESVLRSHLQVVVTKALSESDLSAFAPDNPDRQRNIKIVLLTLGLNGDELPQSGAEIGRRFRISRQRVQQIVRAGMRKLAENENFRQTLSQLLNTPLPD